MSAPVADRATILQYLTDLHGTAPDGLWLTVVGYAPKGSPDTEEKPIHWHRIDDLEGAIVAAERLNAEGFNAYVSMALTDDIGHDGAVERGGRINAAEARAISAVWAEIDLAGLHPSEKTLPPSLEAALKALEASGLPRPTWAILSGGGLHVYWLFHETFTIDAPDERPLIAGLAKGVQEAIRRVFQSYDWHLDPTADLARVLRIPGSVNYNTPEPTLVRFLWTDGPRVSTEDLEPFAFSDDEPRGGQPIVEGKRLTAADRAWYIALFQPYWKAGQRKELTLAIAGWLANCGAPEADALAIVLTLAALAEDDSDAKEIRRFICDTYKKARNGVAVAGWSKLCAGTAPLIPDQATRDALDRRMKGRLPVFTFAALAAAPDSEPATISRDMPTPRTPHRPGACPVCSRDRRNVKELAAFKGAVVRAVRAKHLKPAEIVYLIDAALGVEQEQRKTGASGPVHQPDTLVAARTGLDRKTIAAARERFATEGGIVVAKMAPASTAATRPTDDAGRAAMASLSNEELARLAARQTARRGDELATGEAAKQSREETQWKAVHLAPAPSDDARGGALPLAVRMIAAGVEHARPKPVHGNVGKPRKVKVTSVLPETFEPCPDHPDAPVTITLTCGHADCDRVLYLDNAVTTPTDGTMGKNSASLYGEREQGGDRTPMGIFSPRSVTATPAAEVAARRRANRATKPEIPAPKPRPLCQATGCEAFATEGDAYCDECRRNGWGAEVRSIDEAAAAPAPDGRCECGQPATRVADNDGSHWCAACLAAHRLGGWIGRVRCPQRHTPDKRWRPPVTRKRDDMHLTYRDGRRVATQIGTRGQRAVERASNADRLHFDRHPGADTYLREHVPGEFGEPSTAALLSEMVKQVDLDPAEWQVMVEVTQLAPGCRRRRPVYAIYLPSGPQTGEEMTA